MIVAKYYNGTDVLPVDQPVGTYPVMQNLNVPFGFPGIYSIDGYNFDCRQPGLYRFKLPTRTYYLNHIVAKRMDGSTDLYALMSAISWNQVYGTAHEYANDPAMMTNDQCQALSNDGHYRKWRMRCGYVVRYLLWLLPLFGVNSIRRVQLNTGESFNGYTDGHVAIETYTDGKWVFWDISSGLYFTDCNGCHLSMVEVMEMYRCGGSPIVVRIDATDKWSSDVAAPALDLSVMRDMEMLTDCELDAWHRRVMQIPEINGVAWLPPGTEGKAAWLASRGIQVVSKGAFMTQFYP